MSAPRPVRAHSRRGGHEEEHEEHENHERWLVSYADMMTLLMVLFIVMFALSEVNQRKFDVFRAGLHAGFGSPATMLNGGSDILDGPGSVAPDSPQVPGSTDGGSGGTDANSWKDMAPGRVGQLVTATQQAQLKQEVDNLKKAETALKAALARAGEASGATFRFDERGLVVTIATDKVLFDSGSAQLRPQGRRILDALEPTLAALPNRLSVGGHTNWLPISTSRFPSNWELSTDRATGVLRYLAAPGRIPADRMSATGYADTMPLLPRSNPRAQVVNRRVEIVVLAAVDDAQGRALEALGNGQAASDAAGPGAATSGSATTEAAAAGTSAGRGAHG
ncbi:MAG: OmpA/MotB family protein [Kineosporiaceae bacterium]